MLAFLGLIVLVGVSTLFFLAAGRKVANHQSVASMLSAAGVRWRGAECSACSYAVIGGEFLLACCVFAPTLVVAAVFPIVMLVYARFGVRLLRAGDECGCGVGTAIRSPLALVARNIALAVIVVASSWAWHQQTLSESVYLGVAVTGVPASLAIVYIARRLRELTLARSSSLTGRLRLRPSPH